MKRYLLLDPRNSEVGRLALGSEEWTQGKIRVIDIHERQARTLLEQLPLPDREATACLVTVHRGRVRAAWGGHLAWQLVWILGPFQGRRMWNLAHQTGSMAKVGASRRSSHVLPPTSAVDGGRAELAARKTTEGV